MNQFAQDIQDAAREIRALRHDNALLAAKVQGFEMAVHLVNSQPLRKPGYGAGPDIAWTLDNHVSEILASDVPQQASVVEPT